MVADKRKAVGAKFVEILGNYNPHLKKLEINQEKLTEYLKNGAQPSNTLAKILKQEGIKLPKWVEITTRNRPSKQKEEKAETPTPEKTEAKAAEIKEEKSEAAKPAEEITPETPEKPEEPAEDKKESAEGEELTEDKKAE